MLRCIGGGSYGTVWLARTATGIYRAVKVVWRESFEDAGPYEREFSGLRQFEKVSLVESRQLALLHVGRRDEEGFFYYVMELADDVENGREIDPETYQPFTLREFPRSPSMPVERVLELAIEMVRGLAFLHDRELVHRDIKPSNVILIDGVPKLADIGLVASSAKALTFVGTEGFVAPEGPGKPMADIYALGKVLYELATGLDRQRFPELPADFTDRVDRLAFLELNAVILRACEPDLKRRYKDAGALLEELLMIQAGKSVRRLRAAERGLRMALRWVALLAAVATVAGAGAWLAWSRAQQEIALRAEAEAERDVLARKMQYAGKLAQASVALNNHEYGMSRSLIEEAREILGEEVGVEWRVLGNQSWGNVSQVFRESGAAVRRVVIHPELPQIAVADTANILGLMDIDSREFRTLDQRWGDLAGFSGDGKWLLGTDQNAALCSYRVADGLVVRVLDVEAPSWPIVVQNSGEMLALVVDGGESSLVKVSAGSERAEVIRSALLQDEGDGWNFFRVAASPDDRFVAIGWIRSLGSDVEFLIQIVGLRDSANSAIVRPAGRVDGLGWREDSSTGSFTLESYDRLDDQVYGYKFDSGGITATGVSETKGVSHTLVNSRSREFVIRGNRLTWNLEDGEQALDGAGGALTSIALGRDGARVYAGTEAGELVAWKLQRPVTKSLDFSEGLTGVDVCFSSDDRRLYLADKDGCFVLEPNPNSLVGRNALFAAIWRDDGGRLLGASRSRQEVIWSEAEIVRHRRLVTSPLDPIVDGFASADLTQVVVRSSEGITQLVTENGIGEWSIESGNWWAPAWDFQRGKWWATSASGKVTCRSLTTGKEVWAEGDSSLVANLLYLPDQKLIAAASRSGNVELFDADTGRLVRTFPSGANSPHGMLHHAPDGRLMVGDHRGVLQVFDTADWSYLSSIDTGLSEPIHSVRISKRGEVMVALSTSGRLQIQRID